ncbi:MAG: restriction endonuclease subunit S, partial [Candidatus Cloacimonetes bacterium]|nr:restriction endonuclease subunit S [Candidatus Cloacimonadota bacterium]
MKRCYIRIPESISIDSIEENGYTLSASQYVDLIMPNKNYKLVGDFLSLPLKRSDLGVEVGSLNYISKSPFYFLRTKAFQSYSFLPEITPESALPIMPNVFVKQNLQEGDLLISKDSNIGEIVILEKDYPNFMTSGAIYKLPVNKHRYYLLAFIKHRLFREQLDFMVPKGATIRHAKTMFLDCKIPIPNKNTTETIKYVEMLTQAIVNKEKIIKFRHKNILNAIDNELRQNQKAINFKFDFPTINEIENSSRLDTGTYAEQFKEIDFLIKNYRGGCFFLDKNHLKSGNTPNTRFIGDIDNLKYRWITPTHCSDNGLILIDEGINLKGNNNINENCLLLVNRGQGIDCGKSIFYNFNDYGKGHHNQGMYKVFNYEKEKLIFISCFLNTQLIREYCSKLSLGSKMKELKMGHFLQIPFPNFSEEKQKEIVKLYHNDNITYHPEYS